VTNSTVVGGNYPQNATPDWGGASEAPPPVRQDVRPATVLVVDDDVDMTNLITRYLETVGVRVIAASSGRQCLNLAAQHKIDLLLTDLSLPEMDGFAICRAVKALPDLAEVPIVIMSVRDDEATRREGSQVGARDFLAKPIFRRQLLALLDKHLARARAYPPR